MRVEEMFGTIKRLNAEGKMWNGKPVNALGALAQTYHEASSRRLVDGKKVFVPFGSRLSAEYNNYAGIKCTRTWTEKKISISNGECVDLKTDEFIGGKWDRGTPRGFRVYDSIEHFFQDYSRIMGLYYNPSPDNVWLFLGGLCGVNRSKYCWATGPAYFKSLSNHVVSFGKRLLGPDWRVMLEGSLAKAAPLLTARVPALEVSMAQCARMAIERGGG